MENKITNKLDEISYDQAIFSDKVYRKINNLDNTYSVYSLDFKNNGFIWEKIYNYSLPEGYQCISFDDLAFTHEKSNHINIYNHIDGFATKYMIYKGDNLLIWNVMDIPIDINNLNTHSLLNIPTHINLIDECPVDNQTENYDFLEEYEPLHGWDNLLERTSDNGEYVNENVNENVEEDVNENVNENVEEDEYHEETIYLQEEYRIDPYDGELYSKSEFIEYYGGETEWNHQSPKNILLREEYYKFADTFSHLSDKKFIYLFKKYEKTFN